MYCKIFFSITAIKPHSGQASPSLWMPLWALRDHHHLILHLFQMLVLFSSCCSITVKTFIRLRHTPYLCFQCFLPALWYHLLASHFSMAWFFHCCLPTTSIRPLWLFFSVTTYILYSNIWIKGPINTHKNVNFKFFLKSGFLWFMKNCDSDEVTNVQSNW